ncbi:MAG: putative bifunctional diguanylate cyclase/phosphodiesterase [Alcanivoracaceae bacterium]
MALLKWRRKPDSTADNLARSLADQQDLSRLLQDTADIVVFTQNQNGELLSVNRHGRWLSGITGQIPADLRFLDLLFGAPADLPARLAELFNGRRSHYRHETAMTRPGAEPLLLAWWHVPWHLHDGGEPRLVSIGLDISDQRLAEEHLSWLALHDPLTGLLNRRGFLERARAMVATGGGFSLMLLDLDQFKDINDLRGHHQGDRLLQQVSRVLRGELRQSDIIARLGGDEFGILLPNADRVSVEHAARRCCSALHQLPPLDAEINVAITTSIGVVLCPEHGKNIDELLANADIALYQAKARGRNAWHVFDGDDIHRARIHERVFWDRQIRQLLGEDRVDMHYQPILNLQTREVTHHEALLRGRDENNQALNTAQLILAAEQSGMIHRLDEQVITRVFEHLALLEQNGINTSLAVNLSGRSFNNPNLIGHVRASLDRFRVSSSSVIFEITETAALADIDASIQIMEALRAEGCRFALDDFGVGFSSLYYLKKLPLDYIKIDGSFVRNLTRDSEHQALIRALVDVARAFNLHTIAEFVEDASVLEMLAELGVNYAQGYHIEKPRPFGETWPHQLQ